MSATSLHLFAVHSFLNPSLLFLTLSPINLESRSPSSCLLLDIPSILFRPLQMVQLMKTMSKSVRQRESERAERATLVTQEKLVLAKGRPARLPDLWIRPSFGGKGRKLTGSLEAHTNGFRYSTPKVREGEGGYALCIL